MSYDVSYVKARKKAARQLRNSSAQQLEIETKKMEERIRALKEQMVKEKEEREKLGGTRWMSGKAGPLNSHAQNVLKKKSSKDDKTHKNLKILGDEPLQNYIKKATSRVQQSNDIVASGCGQCERAKATLECLECAEKYCVRCFMSFHQKGALKKHSTQSIDQGKGGEIKDKEGNAINNTTPQLSPYKDHSRVPFQVQRDSLRSSESTRQQGGSLLEGSYNEEESAQSFAQALMQWRKNGGGNPTDGSKNTTCETSTTPEPPKQQEFKVTFGPNKSLSYLDRMLLKKHHDSKLTPQSIHPTEFESVISKQRAPRDDLQTGTENQLGTNYREIFQNLGAPNKKMSQYGTETCIKSKGVLSIEEVNGDHGSNWEETAACIIEEDYTLPHPESRSLSRSPKVSFECMTSSGHFLANSDALHLEDVSPPRLSNTAPHLTLAQEKLSGNVFKRVWSPKPCHMGLSKFFMAGVVDNNSRGRTCSDSGAELGPSSVNMDIVRKSLLSQNLWKPHESVSETAIEGSPIREEKEQPDTTTDKEPVIPLLLEPELSAKNHDRPDSRSSTVAEPVSSDPHYQSLIHDFGIVDFLKIQPNLCNGFENYSLIHRVSTVSPLTLSPNPPTSYWSDDSDDEFLEQICHQTFKDEQKADQDEADRSTLTDLAWELASTTGRLTRCEVDEDNREEVEGVSDHDSIENNDYGSGLSSSEEEPAYDNRSENLSESNEEEENTLAEAVVYELK